MRVVNEDDLSRLIRHQRNPLRMTHGEQLDMIDEVRLHRLVAELKADDAIPAGPG